MARVNGRTNWVLAAVEPVHRIDEMGERLERRWNMTKLSNIRRKAREDRGAALVEFAVVAPLLLILLLGMVEYGWVFSNNLDTRHGAREAARLAAVNWDTRDAIATETCDRMDINAGSGAIITFGGGGGDVGDIATVSISVPYQPIVNFPLIPVPATLDSSIEFRLEQDATWANGAAPPC